MSKKKFLTTKSSLWSQFFYTIRSYFFMIKKYDDQFVLIMFIRINKYIYNQICHIEIYKRMSENY